MSHTGQIFVMQNCVIGAVGDVDDGISCLNARVGDGGLGGGRIRLLVMNRWMKMWISTRAKNFEMSRIYLPWSVLHGGDDGGVVLMIRALKKSILVFGEMMVGMVRRGCRLSLCIESTCHRLFRCMLQGTQS